METAASIIAVIQISEKIIGYIRAVHGAADDREKLRKHVRHSSNTLSFLSDGCEDSEKGQAWAEFIKPLNGSLARLKQALEFAAARLQTRSSLKVKLTWPFNKEEVQGLIDVIKSEEVLLGLALEVSSARLLQEINIRTKECESNLVKLEVLMGGHMAAIEVRFTEIRDDLRAIQVDQEYVKKQMEQKTDAEKQNDKAATLNWLSPIDHLKEQDQHIHRRQAGTCTWFLTSKTYQDWWGSTSQSTLFCPGMPGAGKTVLSSVVIADLWKRYRRDSDVAVTFVFCGFNRHDEQMKDNLLMSILKQLLEPQTSLPDSIGSYYEDSIHPTHDEILELLGTAISIYSSIFIVIDGLDECEEGEGFLSDLWNLQTGFRIRLLVTSRYVTSIENLFQNARRIEVRASDEDVRKYIEAQMRGKRKFLELPQGARDDIKEGIVQSVQGMFLLAKFHLDSLEKEPSLKAMKTASRRLGTGSDAYDSAHDSAMERINSQHKKQVDLAERVLSWIVHAKRQITTHELQHALGIEIGTLEFDRENCPSVNDMISVCAGLVTVDKGMDTIRLVHYTTQNYFERKRHKYFPSAEQDITTLCTTYLSLNAPERSSRSYGVYSSRDSKYVFFDYAAKHWGEHARQASPIPSCVESFLRSSETVAVVAEFLYRLDTPGIYDISLGRLDSGLHMAAYFGLDSVAVALVQETSEPDPCNSEGTTPLMFAAHCGHESVVKALLTVEAAVNAVTRLGRTSLYLAAEQGHAGIVKILLENHADMAAGHTDEIALESYPDIFAGHTNESPLRCAVKFGHEAVVRVLLETWDDLKSQHEEGIVLLKIACEGGHTAVFKLLLDAGADVHDQPARSSSFLHRASEFGYLPIVRLLVDAGVNINGPGLQGASPLINACIEGNRDVVEFLLTRGAEVDLRDDNGDSPLHHASQVKIAPLVELLLNRGARIHCTNKAGQKPFFMACRSGDEATVKILLEAGSDITSQDKRGQTPLHAACYGKNIANIRLLLHLGAQINCKNKEGQTPLHVACSQTHEASVRLLLTANPDINCKNKKGRTPLHEACYANNLAVSKILLEAGAEIFHEDNNGLTPIMVSRKAPHQSKRFALNNVLLSFRTKQSREAREDR